MAEEIRAQLATPEEAAALADPAAPTSMDPDEFIRWGKEQGIPDINIAHALLTQHGPQFKELMASGVSYKDLFGALGLDIGGKALPEGYKATLDTVAKKAGLDKYKLDGKALAGIMQAESSGGKNLLGPLISDSKGNPTFASGHFQLMPQMAKTFGVSDPFDLEQTAPAAAAILRQNLDRYGGDLPKALKAYQAGLDESKWTLHQDDYARRVQDSMAGIRDWDHGQQLASGMIGSLGPEARGVSEAYKTFLEEWQGGKSPKEAYSSAAERYYNVLGQRKEAQGEFEAENPISSKVATVAGALPATLAATALVPAVLPAGAAAAAGPATRIGYEALRALQPGAIASLYNAKTTGQTGEEALNQSPLYSLAGGALGGALGEAGPGIASKVNPYVQSLFQRARQLGLDVDYNQVFARKATSPQQLGNFMSKVSEQFGGDGSGQPASFFSPEVLKGATDRIGGEFKRLLGDLETQTPGKMSVQLSGKFLGNMAKLLTEIDGMPDMPEGTARSLKTIIREFVNNGAKSAGPIDGLAYQNATKWDSPLSNLMQSDNSTVKTMARKIDSALDEALEDSAIRSGNAQDVADLKQAQSQWKNLQIVRDRSQNGVLRPDRLLSLVEKRSPNADMTPVGQDPMFDLARIGQQFYNYNPSGKVEQGANFLHRHGGPLGIGAGAAATEYATEHLHHFLTSSGLGDPFRALLSLGAGGLVAGGAMAGQKAIRQSAIQTLLTGRRPSLPSTLLGTTAGALGPPTTNALFPNPIPGVQ